MSVLARILHIDVLRRRKELEARRRRLVGLIPLDEPDTSATGTEVHAEPPTGGARIIRLEHPAGGKRETRG